MTHQSRQLFLLAAFSFKRSGKIAEEHPCPCCGHLTIVEPGRWDLCEVCFWEDDPIQRNDPDYEGGANVPSLNQARQNYAEFGACEERVLEFVRAPEPEEKKTD